MAFMETLVPIDRWRELASLYSPARDEELVEIINGPLLFTAGHAVPHLCKDGLYKKADKNTGPLALLLAELTSSSALTTKGRWLANPNADPLPVCKFKTRALSFVPSLVFDLHGMSDRHGCDICIGTGALPDLSSELVEIAHSTLTAAGFTVAIDAPFAARGLNTITSTFQAHNTPAVQLEIAASLRDDNNGRDMGAMVEALAQAALRAQSLL